VTAQLRPEDEVSPSPSGSDRLMSFLRGRPHAAYPEVPEQSGYG